MSEKESYTEEEKQELMNYFNELQENFKRSEIEVVPEFKAFDIRQLSFRPMSTLRDISVHATELGVDLGLDDAKLKIKYSRINTMAHVASMLIAPFFPEIKGMYWNSSVYQEKNDNNQVTLDVACGYPINSKLTKTNRRRSRDLIEFKLCFVDRPVYERKLDIHEVNVVKVCPESGYLTEELETAITEMTNLLQKTFTHLEMYNIYGEGLTFAAESSINQLGTLACFILISSESSEIELIE